MPSCAALRRFGAPLHNLTAADLQADGTVFQIGLVDILPALKDGVSRGEFDDFLLIQDFPARSGRGRRS